MESQSKDEFEDVYIFTSLNGGSQVQTDSNVHIMGLDTDKPIVQIDKQIFVGKHEPAMGTYLFFEEGRGGLTPLTHTKRVLSLDRAYITPKQDNNEGSFTQDNEDSEPSKNASVLHVENIVSVEEGLEKLIKAKIWRLADTPTDVAYTSDRQSPEPKYTLQDNAENS